MNIRVAIGKGFTTPYQTVNAAHAGALLAGGAVLLDLRDKHEWQAGHAPKAQHIPLAHMAARHGELAAVGAGVAVAALTNTCAMGALPAKLHHKRGAPGDLDTVVSRLRTGTAP